MPRNPRADQIGTGGRIKSESPGGCARNAQVLSVGEDCPECGGDLSKLGEDITEELEYIPGRFVVNKITRPRMACRRCEAISVDQGPTLQQSRLMIADS